MKKQHGLGNEGAAERDQGEEEGGAGVITGAGGSTVHLQWGSFPSWSSGSWSSLYRDRRLADITLLSQEMVSFRVHKVVLGASSRLLERLVVEHPTPLLFLRGISSSMLEVLIQFVYLGEVEVPQDMVEELLETAQDLGVQGLDGGEPVSRQQTEEAQYGVSGTLNRQTTEQTQQGEETGNQDVSMAKESIQSFESRYPGIQVKDSGMQNNFEAGNNSFKCVDCQKRFSTKSSLDHHKIIHIIKKEFKCDICGESISHERNLQKHIRKCHRQEIKSGRNNLSDVGLLKKYAGNENTLSTTKIFISDPMEDPIKVEEQHQIDENTLWNIFGERGEHDGDNKTNIKYEHFLREPLDTIVDDTDVKEHNVVFENDSSRLNPKVHQETGIFKTNDMPPPKQVKENKRKISQNSVEATVIHSLPKVDIQIVRNSLLKENTQTIRQEIPHTKGETQKEETDFRNGSQIVLAKKPDQAVKCLTCTKQFVNTIHLDQHMKTHMKQFKYFFCDQCNKQIECESLENHKKSVHSSTTRTEEFKCNFCERRFAQENNMNTHMKDRHFEDWAKWKVSLIASKM